MILICRFYLELVKRNLTSEIMSQTHQNMRLSGFRAAICQIGESVDSDFGDHDFFTRTEHHATSQGSSMSAPPINLTEFPWAAGDIQELEANCSSVPVSLSTVYLFKFDVLQLSFRMNMMISSMTITSLFIKMEKALQVQFNHNCHYTCSIIDMVLLSCQIPSNLLESITISLFFWSFIYFMYLTSVMAKNVSDTHYCSFGFRKNIVLFFVFLAI
jgi:hypothetical protein